MPYRIEITDPSAPLTYYPDADPPHYESEGAPRLHTRYYVRRRDAERDIATWPRDRMWRPTGRIVYIKPANRTV